MQLAKRLAPWALSVFLLTAFGCAQQQRGPDVVALEEKITASQAKLAELTTRLAAAMKEVKQARQQAAAANRELRLHVAHLAVKRAHAAAVRSTLHGTRTKQAQSDFAKTKWTVRKPPPGAGATRGSEQTTTSCNRPAQIK